jgi:hypothetical protein
LLWAAAAAAATVDGTLRIEVITAYNLVIDSNIETPAGAGPTACHLGVRIYNDGTNPVTDVYARIGDLTNPATWTGTAGTYPDTYVPPADPRDYEGHFSFTHQGGTADAVRFVSEIPAGEYAAVYWLVSYPVKDANNQTVAGAAADPSDDLDLHYDIWVEGKEGATTRRVYDERTMYCRNEISAMANKIWPNTE